MIRFRAEHLPDVQSGRKTCTIRFWRPSVRPGQRVRLAFGRHDRPVVIEAVVEAVEEYDLTADLMAAAEILEAATEEEAEAAYQRALQELAEHAGEGEGVAGVGDRLMAAIEASGGDYWDLLAEAYERQTTRVYAVWFKLA